MHENGNRFALALQVPRLPDGLAPQKQLSLFLPESNSHPGNNKYRESMSFHGQWVPIESLPYFQDPDKWSTLSLAIARRKSHLAFQPHLDRLFHNSYLV